MVINHVTGCQCEVCNRPEIIVVKGGCYATGDRNAPSFRDLVGAKPLTPPRAMNRRERRAANKR